MRTIPRLGRGSSAAAPTTSWPSPATPRELAGRGILYVPDYLANAGGVIDFHQERIDNSRAAVLAAVGRIEGITAEILEAARATGRTPQEIADQRVRGPARSAARRARAAGLSPSHAPAW